MSASREQKVVAFVKKACKDRPPSHGHAHMLAVAECAMSIVNTLGVPELTERVFVVAMLHDVPDHKYDKDGKLKQLCCDFLLETGYSTQETEDIMNIVAHISYSREVKLRGELGGPVDWEVVLGSSFSAHVRQIVSDADKIQAIGKIGIARCAHYVAERAEQKVEESDLIDAVVAHADEKLLRLYPEFIKTSAGRELAKPLHEEMEEILRDLPSFLNALREGDMSWVY